MKNRVYICIDLKSFYASVECAERGLDAMTTNLVVADPTRSEKTICLAVTPAMKKLGVKNRCRVFEIPKSIDYIMAPPRMQLYIDYSAEIYGIYLKYFSKEDIHVYSVDEAFIDVTDYARFYGIGQEEALTKEADDITYKVYEDHDIDSTMLLGAKRLGIMLMDEILAELGIMSSCGVGTNLYLAKIAMDIMAKKSREGIGVLDEELYRKHLWDHKPLNDFWRVGAGTVRRLARYGINTMRDIAMCDEDLLYKIFGIDAELLIDHAWGREPVRMSDIKNYKSQNHGLTNQQILPKNYNFTDALLIAKEMTDVLCYDLLDKRLATDSITIYVGYANEYGVGGDRCSSTLGSYTSSYNTISNEVEKMFRQCADTSIPIRRIGIWFNRVKEECYHQFDFFTDAEQVEKERNIQKAALAIKKRWGKNAILRGRDLDDNATAQERNNQIGGHKA